MNRPSTHRWRVARRAFLFLAVPAGVIAAAALTARADVPNSFKAGDALSADKLNADFKDVDARLAHPVVAKNAKKYSLGATYCGATANPTTGQTTNGYAGAKSSCEAVAACASSPSAHMCTGDELTRSVQLGVAVTSGWYASGTSAPTAGPPRDCQGYTTASNMLYGAYWQSFYPDVDNCSLSHAVLCCD